MFLSFLTASVIASQFPCDGNEFLLHFPISIIVKRQSMTKVTQDHQWKCTYPRERSIITSLSYTETSREWGTSTPVFPFPELHSVCWEGAVFARTTQMEKIILGKRLAGQFQCIKSLR